MERNPSYFIVGLFVIVLAAGAVLFTLWLGEFHGKKVKYRDYYTYMFESVSGLPKDGAVKYMGVEIGKVTDIHINPKNPTHVRLTLHLPADFIVRRGMYTQLKLEGITGIAYVEISGGRAGAKPIETEKGKIPVIPSRPSALSKLGDSLPEVAVNMAETFKRINQTLDDETIAHIEKIADHLDTATERFNRLLSPENEINFKRALANLAKASDRLDELYATADTIRQVSLELGREGNLTMRSIRQSADAFETVNATLLKKMEGGEFDFKTMLTPTLQRFDTLIDATQTLIYELQSEIETLRQSPRDLLFKEAPVLEGPGEGETRLHRKGRQ
ncbi:MlaD family protein [Hydrogenimonas sp. SS33]|uniref:MlaD family protein n=1 Tax=Hydrogenimonas leucolamina TaxID=2954236 RepID=UPI00336BE12A